MTPRQEPEVARAIALSEGDAPMLALETSANDTAAPQSRQLRRKAMRAEAKAARRAGIPVTTSAARNAEACSTPITPAQARPQAEAEIVALIQGVLEAPRPAEKPAESATIDLTAEYEELAPLPRSRALMARPRGLMRVGHWVRSLVMVDRPKRTATSPELAVAQLKAMRVEIAHMQQTLDRMLAGAPA